MRGTDWNDEIQSVVPLEYGELPCVLGDWRRHSWILAVIGGALIVALATWTIRRRHGGLEPTVEHIRKDFR